MRLESSYWIASWPSGDRGSACFISRGFWRNFSDPRIGQSVHRVDPSLTCSHPKGHRTSWSVVAGIFESYRLIRRRAHTNLKTLSPKSLQLNKSEQLSLAA